MLAGSALPEVLPSDSDGLSSVIVEIHQRARVLKRLPPLHLWKWKQKRFWERSTREFTPYFDAALRADPESTDFLRVCLRVLELPYLALAKTLPAEQPLTEGRASLSSRLRRVEVLTLQNRLREAGKILCSHGIVPASEDGYKRLSKLHPALKETIPSLSTDVPQFFITPLQAAKALHKLCGEKWVSLDPFGWSTALLHLVRGSRGVTAESPITFFRLFATLVSKVAAAEVSDLVAFVLSSGSVLALNKDSEEERKTRETKGLPPRERPINQGSMVLQMAFGLALSSDPAKKAMHELRPTQQGVGAERGMELIAHSCSAHYQEGNFAILKLDATNGFQELKRASLHQKVLQRCPSLLCLFQKYYTAESMCFYSMVGRAGTRLLRSRE